MKKLRFLTSITQQQKLISFKLIHLFPSSPSFTVPSKEPQDAEKADKLQSAKMTSKTNKRIDNDHTKRSQITKGFNKQKTEAKVVWKFH